MNLQRPRARFDGDRLLVVLGLTASTAYGLLAVASLLLQVGGR